MAKESGKGAHGAEYHNNRPQLGGLGENREAGVAAGQEVFAVLWIEQVLEDVE